ncbi:MAG TPA: hypothetical protein VJ464_15940 [Blastocatellia bacterium]|nr:hypothetical protein [Blastocatellia bacterium]
MKKLLRLKPQRPLGELIGPVRIIETDLFAHFIVEQVSTGKALGWRSELDEVIGYCHQNLIPIQSVERLNVSKEVATDVG